MDIGMGTFIVNAKLVNMTIVDTNGKVLRVGTQGLRIVSEEEIHLFDISEVSDETCMNIFIQKGEHVKNFGFLPKDDESVSDLEILIPRDEL